MDKEIEITILQYMHKKNDVIDCKEAVTFILKLTSELYWYFFPSLKTEVTFSNAKKLK